MRQMEIQYAIKTCDVNGDSLTTEEFERHNRFGLALTDKWRNSAANVLLRRNRVTDGAKLPKQKVMD